MRSCLAKLAQDWIRSIRSCSANSSILRSRGDREPVETGTRKAILAITALFGLAIALAGCGSSPETHFHALAASPPAQDLPGSSSGPVLQVGEVSLPGMLDRQSMVTRGPGTEINVSSQNRWAAPLDELIRRALTGDLRSRLGDSRVVSPGDRLPSDGKIIVLNVQQYSADQSGMVVLEADWSLVKPNTKTPPQSNHVRIQVQAPSSRADAVTEAMSQALGQLADRIAVAV